MRAPGIHRTGRARRARDAAFTLIELLVALVAGLIVALSIVTLSKEATRSFHEEVRSSAAESTMRNAVDRLTADLARAGFMSTGNIGRDPMVARLLSDSVAMTNSTIPAVYAGIHSLASIRLYDNPSATTSALPLSAAQVQPVTPDRIDIGGNMTSSEEFEVTTCGQGNADNINGGTGPANCQQIVLAATSAAIDRLNGGPLTGVPADGGTYPGDAELRNIFAPVPTTLNPQPQFIVRMVDSTGHYQFLATCPTTSPPVAGITNGVPYVWVRTDTATGTPIILDSQTGSGGSGGGVPASCAGARINPVQIVRWEITHPANSAGTPPDPEPAQYAALDNTASATGGDPLKYDLVRSFVDATGTLVPQTSEVVAEYAVDLDFAFSVETGNDATAPSPTMYAFDDPSSALYAADVSQAGTAKVGPQRIRSVRVRIATRTAQADRSLNIPPTPANYTNGSGSTATTQAFMYRYCMTAGGCGTSTTALQWARVRTVTSEVSLPNLARSFYP
jgi:type II secretory pathway pseudopilin PulG